MKTFTIGINDFSPGMQILNLSKRGISPKLIDRRRKSGLVGVSAIAAPSQAPSTRQGKGSIKFRTLDAAKEAERRAKGEAILSQTGQREWVDAMELKDTGAKEMAAVLQEMGQHYNPRRLAAALEGRQLQTNTRALRITFTLGKFIAKIAKDYALGEMETKAAVRAQELRDLLGQLGPSFVKVGQALSARPDLLPKVYLETLSALQDRLPPFPTDEAMAVIEAEVGPVAEIFSYITPEPIAAASLGQVYKGVLRATGEEVAVKVQRPNISENIAIDMVLLRRFMSLVDSRLPSLVDYPIQPLVPLVDEFAEKLFGELNYMQEGRNAERFQALYGKIPRVRVPQVKWGGLTSRRVLTMEFINGCKLTDSVAMARNGLSILDFVDVGIECSLRQLLAEDGGFFHADPHPGNLLAMPSGELCYLDFGMMSEAPQYARYAIISHVTHLVNRDYEAMCRDYYVLQFMDRSVDTRPIAPALANFFDDVLDQSISQLNFKAIVDGLGGVLFKYPFRVPAYYALILRSLTVLEGLALQADPRYKLLKKAFPYIAQRVLTDDSPELRQSFRETVLDEEGRLRWGRLENLVEEGSKSLDYNPQQLWLLAKWLLGPQGDAVRKPLVEELARLMDAATAEEARRQVLQRTNNPQLVERLVPVQPGDEQAAQRGRILFGTIFKDVSAEDIAIRGSGPFGIPMPQDIRRLTGKLEASLGRSWPQIQELLQVGGAVEARGMLINSLVSRATARFVKLMFGPTPKNNPRKQVSGVATSIPITAGTTVQTEVLPPLPRSQI